MVKEQGPSGLVRVQTFSIFNTGEISFTDQSIPGMGAELHLASDGVVEICLQTNLRPRVGEV